MSTLVKVTLLDDLWDGEMASFNVSGQKVLLVRLDGQVHAFVDRCAHLGVPLSQGSLDGHVLTCSAHGYQYDARTGQGINPASTRLASLPVTISSGAVFVDPQGALP